MNVVMTGDGRLVEVQATAERDAVHRASCSTRCSTSRRRGSTRSPRAQDEALDAAACLALPTLDWDEALLRLVARGRARRRDRARARAARARGRAAHASARLRSARRSSRSSPPTASTTSCLAATVVRADPTRIAAQIVTGIGFLGAGAIIRQGLSVRGLTTAATLWVVAAIGMAAGAGYYSGAVITTALVLVALWPLRIVAYRVSSGSAPRRVALLVELRPGTSAGELLDAARARARRASSTSSSRHEGDRAGVVRRHAAEHARGAAARRASSPTLEDVDDVQLDRRERGPRLAATRTRRASCAPRCRAGRSSCSTPTTIRPRTGGTYYENARAKARFGRDASSRRRVGARRGLGDRGRRPRRPARACTRARFGGDEPSARLLARARRRRRTGRAPLRLRARRARPRRRRAARHRHARGRIADEPRGSEGFGYDPIFVPDGEERTVAELGNEWKRTHSHRARAAAARRAKAV